MVNSVKLFKVTPKKPTHAYHHALSIGKQLKIAGYHGPVESELLLRPKSLDEYVGQTRLKKKLRVYLEAARERGEPLDHLLLSGPPGLGKTTLAHVIAYELGVQIRVTSGPAIEKPGDLAAILTNSLEEGDILFIDEIHRLSKTAEEHLYPAMEEFKIDLVLGQGPAARTLRLELPRFTLIGATTRPGLLSGPLRSRFGIHEQLEFYTPEELAEGIMRDARLLGVGIEPEAARVIGERSRGTMRIAKRLFRRVRDFAQVAGEAAITRARAEAALDELGLDRLGLDAKDRRYLETLLVKFAGGPVGLETLATALAEDPHTLEEVVEPYLIQIGLVKRTPRGRVATRRAFEHLGLPVPEALF